MTATLPASEVLRKLKIQARGVHRPGVMNGTESEYAALLETRKLTGDIAWYSFEAITLKLAQDTRLTPDFLVMRGDGSLECHEVKGFWEDDARVKIKVAAEKFPFRFIAVQRIPKKHGGGWKAEEF